MASTCTASIDKLNLFDVETFATVVSKGLGESRKRVKETGLESTNLEMETRAPTTLLASK